MSAPLHHLRPAFAHDETLLDLAAGARSLIARFDALVDRYAPIAERELPDEPLDDPTAFVLGLIAIRTRLSRHLELALASDPQRARSERPERERQLGQLGALLR